MQRLQQHWDDLCSLIIRPLRCQYELAHLGPPRFTVDGGIYRRHDSEIENPKGQVLRCSHFEPVPSQRRSKKMPCVIYLHGNCGSRVDALEAVELLLPAGITVFTFDFAGSGMSDGEYVSLGFYEKQDLCAVVEHLQGTGTVSNIGFWGRSMGAVTAIMFASRDPDSVRGIVCDSPFSSLADIVRDIVQGYRAWIPRMAVDLAFRRLRASILDRAQFDIGLLDTTLYAKECKVPAIVAHGKDDTLVPNEHSQRVRAEFRPGTYCHKCDFAGDHNTERPEWFHDMVLRFFREKLAEQPPERHIDPSNGRRRLGPFEIGQLVQTPQQEVGTIVSFDRDCDVYVRFADGVKCAYLSHLRPVHVAEPVDRAEPVHVAEPVDRAEPVERAEVPPQGTSSGGLLGLASHVASVNTAGLKQPAAAFASAAEEETRPQCSADERSEDGADPDPAGSAQRPDGAHACSAATPADGGEPADASASPSADAEPPGESSGGSGGRRRRKGKKR